MCYFTEDICSVGTQAEVEVCVCGGVTVGWKYILSQKSRLHSWVTREKTYTNRENPSPWMGDAEKIEQFVAERLNRVTLETETRHLPWT